MICEKIRAELEKLFDGASAPAKANNGEEEKAAEEQPRANGVITTDYAACGYHLDVQLAPEQLCDAVRIIDNHKFFIEAITGVDWS